MIKFFRRIRQRLLAENRISKYLLYAIGEIILVVVGILIALQINNWNEQRIERRVELQLLRAFHNGLEKDLSDLEGNVRWHTRGLAAADTILNALEHDVPYDLKKISRNFSDLMTPTFFEYSTSAFETLKSKGVTLISNEALREDIIGVYDSGYTFFLTNEAYFVSEIERGYKEVFPMRFVESYRYDLTQDGFPGSLTPLDFEALKTDQEFLYYLKSFQNRTRIQVDWQYSRLRNRIVGVKEQIRTEIEKLEAQ